ncbi:MAG TPA: endonuclease/exonuclease/phosphatase family protein [Polyangiaceae bacterium]|nr:endonuclease/exonuclease/phosphatase family protein [Polyangiaceae bacterium]
MLSLRAVLVSSSLFACLGCDSAKNYLDPHGPRYAGDYADGPDTMSALPQLMVVTFNIKFGEAFEAAGEQLATDPQLSAADIVLLQEMDAPSTDAIAKILSMSYVYYPGSVQTNGRDFGNAVLSRWPLVADKKLILPHKNPMDGRIRIAVEATVATPLGELAAYSVHTETPWLGPSARLDQAAVVIADARAAGRCSLAGGDFNTSDPGTAEQTIDLFQAGGFDWASSGVGDTAGSFALDHIFVKQLVPLESGSVDTQASDHRPSWARLQLEPAP